MKNGHTASKNDELTFFQPKYTQKLSNPIHQLAIESYIPKVATNEEALRRIQPVVIKSPFLPDNHLLPLTQYSNFDISLHEDTISQPKPVPMDYVNELNSNLISVHHLPNDPTEQSYYPSSGYYQPKQIHNRLTKPVYAFELPISKF